MCFQEGSSPSREFVVRVIKQLYRPVKLLSLSYLVSPGLPLLILVVISVSFYSVRNIMLDQYVVAFPEV